MRAAARGAAAPRVGFTVLLLAPYYNPFLKKSKVAVVLRNRFARGGRAHFFQNSAFHPLSAPWAAKQRLQSFQGAGIIKTAMLSERREGDGRMYAKITSLGGLALEGFP